MDTAWEHILSKSVTDEQAGILKNIFNDSEYLISREFTPLHKLVLGLARGLLADELSMSTKGINTVDANGRTSLSWAAARGDHKASQALLDAGADPRIPDYENISPLFHAIKRSDVEGTRLLINHGADATKRDVNGGTAIHVACHDHENPEMLELLSSVNVDVNAIDFAGDPALHYTAWADFHNSASKLLELGADPYIRNVSGDSIVHMAIYHRAYKILYVLLKYGVRMDAMTVQRQTILHSACETPNAKILSVLATADLEFIDFEAMDTRGKKYDDCFRDRADPDDKELWDAFHSLIQHVQDLSHRAQTLKAPVEGEKAEGDDEQEEVIEIFYDVQEMV
jgi:ankyrin repeat protein